MDPSKNIIAQQLDNDMNLLNFIQGIEYAGPKTDFGNRKAERFIWTVP
jgi:hypothetical protein